MDKLLSSAADLFERRKYSDLIQLADEHSSFFQKDPYLLKLKAASFFCIGNYEDAYRILSYLEAFFGESADFLSLYAATARRLGDFEKSKVLFLKALSVDPTSLQIQNNYSNLLIDLHEYSEAKSILENVVKSNSSYRDAINNLDRINQLISTTSFQNTHVDTASSSSSSSLNLDDPLLFAFHDDEIDFSRTRYIDKYKNQQDSSFADNSITPSSDSVALDQLEAAALALSEKNSVLVLKLCSQARLLLPTNPRVYEYASDAYLNIKLFQEAECCLLHSISLGGSSLKHYFNMVTFCRMRKDFSLASFYLSKASHIDPSSQMLSKIKAVLDAEIANVSNPYSFSTDWSQNISLKTHS